LKASIAPEAAVREQTRTHRPPANPALQLDCRAAPIGMLHHNCTVCGPSRTRSRLPHEAHETVFGWVLRLVAERGLVKGERIGVDGSTMEANAALRTIVRSDSGALSRSRFLLVNGAGRPPAHTSKINNLHVRQSDGNRPKSAYI
jgi:hypothetical protein